jgi:hypothetical protein
MLLQGQPLRRPHREGRCHQTGRHGFDGRADGPSLQVGEDEFPYVQGDQHTGDLLAGKDGVTKPNCELDDGPRPRQ